MTGNFPTTRDYPDVTSNGTQANTTVMAACQKPSSSPLLWIPYILIGVSCVVFLAVHFWCYHKRNRQRYLRKREEKRVKCGLLERRRITTLMVARYQSDLDVDTVVETEISSSANGGVRRASDVDVYADDSPCANGSASDGHRQIDRTPDGKSPTRLDTILTLPQAFGEDPGQHTSASPQSTISTSFPPQGRYDYSAQPLGFPSTQRTRYPFTRFSADSATRLPFPSSDPLGRYHMCKSEEDDDDEEDAASAPTTPMSPNPFNSKPYTTTLKTGKYPNVIYTILNQPVSPSKAQHTQDKMDARKYAPSSLGDLYEYNMTVDSPVDSKSINDTHITADLTIDMLEFLDCNPRNESQWRCTPPRASPERDLDSITDSPNLVHDRRSKVESKMEIDDPGLTPSPQDLHHTSDDASPMIISPEFKSPTTQGTVFHMPDQVSDFSNNAYSTTSTNDKANISPSAQEVDPRSSHPQSDSSVPRSFFPKLKTAISTERIGSNLETPPAEKANNIKLSNDPAGSSSLASDKDGNANTADALRGDNEVIIGKTQQVAPSLDNQTMSESIREPVQENQSGCANTHFTL